MQEEIRCRYLTNMKIFHCFVSMILLIEYHDSRYLLVKLTGSGAKHGVLPSTRAAKTIEKNKHAGMILILHETHTHIYIYISSYGIYLIINWNYVPYIQDLASIHWIAQEGICARKFLGEVLTILLVMVLEIKSVAQVGFL